MIETPVANQSDIAAVAVDQKVAYESFEVKAKSSTDGAEQEEKRDDPTTTTETATGNRFELPDNLKERVGALRSMLRDDASILIEDCGTFPKKVGFGFCGAMQPFDSIVKYLCMSGDQQAQTVEDEPREAPDDSEHFVKVASNVDGDRHDEVQDEQQNEEKSEHLVDLLQDLDLPPDNLPKDELQVEAESRAIANLSKVAKAEALSEESKTEAKTQAKKEAKAKKEAEAKAKKEAEAKAKKEAEAKAKKEAEAKAAAKAKKEAEAKAKKEAEAKAKKEKAEAKAREKAEAKAKAEAAKVQAKAKAEAAKAKAEAEAMAKSEARARAKADAKIRAEAIAKLKVEAKSNAMAEARAAAKAKAKADAAAKAAAKAKAKADAEAKAAEKARAKAAAKADALLRAEATLLALTEDSNKDTAAEEELTFEEMIEIEMAKLKEEETKKKAQEQAKLEEAKLEEAKLEEEEKSVPATNKSDVPTETPTPPPPPTFEASTSVASVGSAPAKFPSQPASEEVQQPAKEQALGMEEPDSKPPLANLPVTEQLAKELKFPVVIGEQSDDSVGDDASYSDVIKLNEKAKSIFSKVSKRKGSAFAGLGKMTDDDLAKAPKLNQRSQSILSWRGKKNPSEHSKP